MVFANPVTNCIYRIYFSTHTYVTPPSFKPNTSFHKRNFTEKYRLQVKPHFYHANTRIFYSYSVNIYHQPCASLVSRAKPKMAYIFFNWRARPLPANVRQPKNSTLHNVRDTLTFNKTFVETLHKTSHKIIFRDSSVSCSVTTTFRGNMTIAEAASRAS